MIIEIGIVVALYVLARLLADRLPGLAKVVGAVGAVMALIVAIDLGVRIFREGGIGSFLPKAQDAALSEKTSAAAQVAEGSVTRASGGRITTELGFGIAVAKDSTLEREWIAVHHPSLPVALEGTPGVTTVYVRQEYSGEYRYRANFTVNAKEAVKAFEVRFLTFDVWGEHVRTLDFEQVSDIPANTKREFNGQWNLFSENDVEKHYASIAYVARVRRADGQVIEAPLEKVIEEAQKFSEKFSAAQLEPPAPAAPPGRPGG